MPESFFLIVAKNVTLLKKETLVQVFFCEFCEISQTAFFTKDSFRHLQKPFQDARLND